MEDSKRIKKNQMLIVKIQTNHENPLNRKIDVYDVIYL